MKRFKQLIAEVAQPKSEDELNFKAKHEIEMMDHPESEEHQHTAEKKSPKRRADYKDGEDMAVYEAKLDAVNPKALKGDFEDREDKDINNDGKVDSTDRYLHARRKAIAKSMKENATHNLVEKARSAAQQKAAAVALAVKRGDMPKSALQGASKDMYKMSEKDLEDFAKTKHSGIPERVSEVKEEVELDEATNPKEFLNIAKRLTAHSKEIASFSMKARMQGKVTRDAVNDLRDNIQAIHNDLGYMIKDLKNMRLEESSDLSDYTVEELDQVNEATPTKKAITRALQGMKVQPKEKVSLKKAPWEKNEEVELTENFKAGSVKLNDGSSVLVKKQDADLLNKMFKDLNATNRARMMKVAMTDKAGFEEILGFAREAL